MVDSQQQALAELNATKAVHLAGKLEEAIRRYQALLKAHPTFADVLHPLGIAFQQMGRHAEAAEAIGHWVTLVPQDYDALINLSNSLLALGRAADAVQASQRAAALRPDAAGAHAILAQALHASRDLAGARTSYERALALEPNSAECLFNFANLLVDGGLVEEAVQRYRDALKVRADLPEVYVNLANNLVRLGKADEAIGYYHIALRLRPGMPEALVNLGNALFIHTGDLDGARRCFEAVIAQAPTYRDALNNLTSLAMEAGDMVTAVRHARRMLEVHPHDQLLHTTAAGLFMSLGQWEEGWQHFEWRWLRPNLPVPLRDFGRPEWQGEDISGKTILIHHEQGLGDSIQFVRFVQQVVARAAHVILEVPSNLLALYRLAMTGVTLATFGEPLPPFDVHVPIMSLARVLGVTVDRVPAPIPYLRADPDRVDAWRNRLPKGGFRIGVVWQGKPGTGVDRGRSFGLEHLAPVARVPCVTLISLQKGFGLDQLDRLPDGMKVQTLGPDFDEGPDAFMDTAAVMQHLDLIISSDTSVAHLAGALGCPVWVPLKFAPDWRWMRNREDSPWYPRTMRLFRQSTAGDWASVFQRLATEVALLKDGDASRLSPASPPPRRPPLPFPPVPTPPLPAQRPPVLSQQMVTIGNQDALEAATRLGVLRYPSSDRILGRCLEADGEWLEGEVEACARTLEPGETVVEVGAGIGLHALALSKQFKVHAFEPETHLRELMQWNMAHVHHGSVTPLQGDGTGIDALGLDSLHLIKVSVDALVLRVLKGARSSILQHRPCLYLRCDAGKPDQATLDLLREMNYRVWQHTVPLHVVPNFRGNSTDPFPGVIVCNLICVPAGRQAVMHMLPRLL
ncbi:MAG: tetratricopeptide repeat protein [Niveispirillum sp.]|uniref:tetratricopeptide repeat protein n=1 Tax=Niveispirillum sp. TaxID=1917217 RepID=UPI004035A375